MKKISQGEVEREFQKALAVEYVKNYCKENGLSIQKLRKQNFALCDNECAFYVQPIDYVKTDQLVIDGGLKPQVTLIIRHENEELQIEETEYTEVFLKKE